MSPSLKTVPEKAIEELTVAISVIDGHELPVSISQDVSAVLEACARWLRARPPAEGFGDVGASIRSGLQKARYAEAGGFVGARKDFALALEILTCKIQGAPGEKAE